ncbi:hypothetical protein Avbf_07457 [Armadillidium vulgare]|nr:hypothetical protein Avbf_07457 [Armadillidium vulgare]
MSNVNFRSKVVSEIIETEKTYLIQLEKLQTFFSKPSLERGLLPSHAHSAIFGQLSAIYQMNSKLLEEILLEKG